MLAERINQTIACYLALREIFPLGVIRTEEEYSVAVSALDEIVDEIGDDESHELAELADALSVFIEAYDKEHYEIPEVSGVDALLYLMKEQGLRQSDLPEIGSQGVVSEILAGKRNLNLKQVVALAERFHLPVEIFAT